MLRFLGVYMRVVVDVSINATFMLTTLDSTFAGCLKLATCKVLVHMAILSRSAHS